MAQGVRYLAALMNGAIYISVQFGRWLWNARRQQFLAFEAILGFAFSI